MGTGRAEPHRVVKATHPPAGLSWVPVVPGPHRTWNQIGSLEESIIWKTSCGAGRQVPGHLQGPQRSDSCGLKTSDAFGHCSSDRICSFSCPTVSGLKHVRESFLRYLKWSLACRVLAQRATRQMATPTAAASVRAHVCVGLVS